MRHTARSLLVGAVVLSLAGCATVGTPVQGLSDAERAAIQQQQRDAHWQMVGLPDDQRPPDPSVTVVSRQEWAQAYVSCMNDAGFDNYEAFDDGSYSVTGGDEGTTEEYLADYLCTAGLWYENDDGWYNHAQLTALYDYYDEVLVPCLETHEISIFTAPTREDFFDQFGWWHPYNSIREADQEAMFGNRQMLVKCPPLPPGMTDPGYARYWDFWDEE